MSLTLTSEEFAANFGTCYDCYKDRVVKDRVLLLRKRSQHEFEDCYAAAHDPRGSPILIIKSNKNPQLEQNRLDLMNKSAGTCVLAQVLLKTRFHNESTNVWTCFMTAFFNEVHNPAQLVQAMRITREKMDASGKIGVPEAPLVSAVPAGATSSTIGSTIQRLEKQLAEEKAARELQNERLVQLEQKLAAITAQPADQLARLESRLDRLEARLDSTRTAVENLRLTALKRKRKRNATE